MKVLVTSRTAGRSGSFEIRGRQLGAAIGATITPQAHHFHGFDAVIFVKRPRPYMVDVIHDAGVPLVWDVVDSWTQPEGNDWDRPACLDWLAREVATIRPAAIVAATRQMASDLESFGLPVLALPHHARPGQRRNPLRETVRTVGYEGDPRYLGRWHGVLERECAARGWTFDPEPRALADLDIVVALRDAIGYAPRNWKSNVKMANAQASGTPSIVNRECGCTETACPGQLFADTETELRGALDALTGIDERRRQVEQYRAPTLEAVAKDYRAWLSVLKF